jgi:hypothetical protein
MGFFWKNKKAGKGKNTNQVFLPDDISSGVTFANEIQLDFLVVI